MPAWFDIESLDNLEEETDIEGVKRSADSVFKIIDGEVRSGIPSNKIMIGGFSQGTILVTSGFATTHVVVSVRQPFTY